MSEAQPDIDDPVEAQLARLAALDLAAVEKVHGRLMAAEEDAAVADLGRTYQRLARSLRQTLALKARLVREREADIRAAAEARTGKPGGVAVARRIRDLRTALHRIAWNEYEREVEDHDPEVLDQLRYDVEQQVVTECLTSSFCDEPLDDHVARLCLTLGLSPHLAETWRDLPDPPALYANPDGPDEPDSS